MRRSWPAPPSRPAPPSARSARMALLRSSRAGKPLEGSGGAGGSGAARTRRLPGDEQPADRAGFLAVMKQNRGGGACRRRSRRRRHRPGRPAPAPARRCARGRARQGWPSMAMTRTSWPSSLTAITVRWQPLIKRSRSRSLRRNVKSERKAAVDGVERRGVPGSMPGAIAVPSGRSRQSSIRSTSSRSTATGSLFRDDQRQAPGRAGLTIAEQAEVTQEGAGVAQWNLERFPWPPPPAAPGRPAVRRRSAVRSRANGNRRDRQLVRELTSRVSPRLNRRSGPGERPDRRIRAARTQRERCRLWPATRRRSAPGRPRRR